MQDIIYVAIAVAFFALCIVYVRGLDRLVRTGQESERAADLTDDPNVAGGEVVEVWS